MKINMNVSVQTKTQSEYGPRDKTVSYIDMADSDVEMDPMVVAAMLHGLAKKIEQDFAPQSKVVTGQINPNVISGYTINTAVNG